MLNNSQNNLPYPSTQEKDSGEIHESGSFLFFQSVIIKQKSLHLLYTFREVTMRIQEVSRQTGLSRRTIYYYIDQKLITREADEANGYHDFSEKDVQKLFLVRKLREAGLPLADIQAILKQPRTTPFYLHKQLNVLQSQLLSIQQTISEIDRLTGQLPVCQSLEQLAAMLQETQFQPDDSSRYQMESRDAQLLAQYLWMAYLDTPVTEYQQFLWQKITQATLEHAGTDLKTMSRYLQYISPEQIDATNINQYLRNQKIISLTEADHPQFVEELKHSLLAFASDPLQQEKWNLLYQPVIHPTALFCVSGQRVDAGMSSQSATAFASVSFGQAPETSHSGFSSFSAASAFSTVSCLEPKSTTFAPFFRNFSTTA